VETEWKQDGNMMETMETEHLNEGIEWKHDGNDGNRTCNRACK